MYITQKAVFEIPYPQGCAKWVDEKEFALLEDAENYAREHYGSYTEPNKDLKNGYFGSQDRKVMQWSGRIIKK